MENVDTQSLKECFGKVISNRKKLSECRVCSIADDCQTILWSDEPVPVLRSVLEPAAYFPKEIRNAS